MVPAMSHSRRHTPGVVDGGGTVVVVVVVVVRLVTASVLTSSTGLIEIFLFRNFSMEKGVVEDVGQPVNSVVALQDFMIALFQSTYTISKLQINIYF